jgi:DNA-binding CsgD family transcriptional regulator
VVVETREIVGREDELAELLRALERARRATQEIVLEGAAGIGKTTLWRAAMAEAERLGFQVLASGPSEAEMHLAYGGLRDLVDGVFEDVAAALPSPQLRALEVALLRADPQGRPPDQGAVAAAFLASLRLLGERSPVLVAIDDAQWLDTSTQFLLGFAARRLRVEQVALLLSVRSGYPNVLLTHEQLHVTLGPLSIGALHRMLRMQLGYAPSRPRLVRLHELSGGNPFYALEIARALQRRNDPTDAQELPLPARLQDLVAERLAALPPRTLEALQVAAALSQPTVSVVASAVEDAAAALEPARQAGVISIEADRIAFDHPMLASGAYASVGSRQRDLHKRLADLVDEPEERAKHLARGAAGPDAAVAADLEKAAQQARARGAPSAAADLAEQAARLTRAGESDLLRRLMEAASNSFEAGDADRARALFEEVAALAPAGPSRAEALARLARAHGFASDLRVAADLYRRAIEEAEPVSATCAEAEEGLAVALMRQLEDLPGAARHAARAIEIAESLGDGHALTEFRATHALILGLRGDRRAMESMEAIEETEPGRASHAFGPSEFLSTLWGKGFMSPVLRVFADDLVGARARLERALARAVEGGDDASLPLIFRYLTLVELLSGDWERARQHADEGYDASIQTGQLSQQAVLAGSRALLAAHTGDVEAARAGAEEALRLASATGSGFAELNARWALGLLELSLGDAERAAAELEPLVARSEAAGIREPGVARFVPDAIEARIRLGQLDRAAPLLARFEDRARELDRPSALAASARCRALLLAARGDFDAASIPLAEALVVHSLPFDRARTLLVRGEIERRARRKRVAREALEEALHMCEHLGARLLAGRVRAELGRIGGRKPTGGQLTPTERRVAALVAEGRSTKEVAATLFVSPKTVEGHLSRIYAKLGIHSRAALAREVATER